MRDDLEKIRTDSAELTRRLEKGETPTAIVLIDMLRMIVTLADAIESERSNRMWSAPGVSGQGY